MADFDANIIVKLGNAATKADFEMSVLTPVYETHKPHTNAYDGEGTPNPKTECFSWVARECPPSTPTMNTDAPVFLCMSSRFSGFT